jgi:hypothetical protein
MDGYSVKDAALVLGIPERRVWELVARGVLASSREGPDGIRVFLQPRTPPVDPASEPRIYRADEPDPQQPRTNGNGGSHEMSPFRELLTEFRSLTERYGQALLALGEARGEVAALRSRVELLEARMDLRLPGTRPASTVAWEIPGYRAEERPQPSTQPLPQPEPMTEAPPAEEHEGGLPELVGAAEEPVAETVTPEHEEVTPAEPSPSRQRRVESRRRKLKGGRSALVGIAEALARAEDPTLSELPGADEAGEAMAALQRDVEASRADVAEEEPTVAEVEAETAWVEAELAEAEQQAPAEAGMEEAELFATFAMPAVSVPVADAESETSSESVPAESAEALAAVSFEAAEEQLETEAEPAEFAEPEPVPQPEVVAPVEAEIEAPAAEAEQLIAEEAIEPAAEAFAEYVEPEPMPQPDAVEPEASAPSEIPKPPEQPHELVAAPGSPYSTEVVEPDWFADGDFTWLEAAQAEAAQQAEATEPRAEPEAEPDVTVAEGEPEPAAALAHEPEPMMAAGEPAIAFEPTARDELRAEEEARAAIQDAFEEPTTDRDMTETSVAFEQPPEPERVEAPEPAEEAIQEAFSEPPVDVDSAAQADSPSQVDAEPQPDEEPAFPAEVDQPSFQVEEASVQEEAPTADEPSFQAQEPPPMEADAVAAPETEPEPTTPPTTEAAAPSGEEELMWLGDEFEEASLEVAAKGWRSADAPIAQAPEAAVLELSDSELSQLAEDEGWDVAEVEAIRSLLGRATPHVAPGAEVAAIQPEAPAMPPASATRRHSMSSMSDPRWLKGRRGPAATAYRRLRRLFPG